MLKLYAVLCALFLLRPAHAEVIGSTSPMFFGSVAVRIVGAAREKTWSSLRDERADHLLNGCSGPICRSSSFQKLRITLSAAKDQPLRTALQTINARVNEIIRHRADEMRYGADHWASFSEAVIEGQGDCEDIALVKMWMLRALGMPSSSLHLVIVRAPGLAKDHAVLVATLGGVNLVLDSLSASVVSDRVLASYRPILSFGDQVWAHGYRHTRPSLVAAR